MSTDTENQETTTPPEPEQKDVCRGGVLDGWTFHYKGKNSTMTHRNDFYDLTTEVDGKNRRIWQSRNDSLPLERKEGDQP